MIVRMYLVFSLIAPGTQVTGSRGSENIVIRIDTEVAQEKCEEVISNIKVSDDENIEPDYPFPARACSSTAHQPCSLVLVGECT